jgi:hypothetical protein
MATYEITITGTIQAATEAEASKKAAELQLLLSMPMVKTMVAAKGVTLGAISKPKAK